MTEFVGGQFPYYRFSTKEEVRAFLLEAWAERIKKTPDLVGREFNIDHHIEDAFRSLEREFEDKIYGRKGTVSATQIENSLNFLTRQAQYAIGRIDALAKAMAANDELVKPFNRGAEAPSPKLLSKGQKGLLIAGIVAGGGLAVHGVISAATAVHNDPECKRDWKKTALHTGEAIAGVALSWALAVVLRRGSGVAR